MNRYFIKKAIGAGCLIVMILSGFMINIKQVSLKIDWGADPEQIITEIESGVNEQFYGRHGFIDLFGALQKMMGKREMNDFEVVQDEQGFLHYTYFGEGASETIDLVESLNDYRNGIKDKNVKFMYAMTPDKFIPGYTTFSKGLPYNYANETADLFLEHLQNYKIDSLDFRVGLEESGINKADLFYKTDHHWKVETAFWGFTRLLDELREKYDLEIPNYKEVTNLDNYNQITYPNSFIGSMGRKNGVYYSGVDDFTFIYPKFQTEYAYKAITKGAKIETYGTFDQALLCMVPFAQDRNKYDVMSDKYAGYLYGNQGIAHIKNKKVKGPKIMLVKDSFMLPLASFLSTVCSDVYLVDARYYEKSILDYTNSIKNLDYVIVSYTPQDLTEEFFQFQ